MSSFNLVRCELKFPTKYSMCTLCLVSENDQGRAGLPWGIFWKRAHVFMVKKLLRAVSIADPLSCFPVLLSEFLIFDSLM